MNSLSISGKARICGVLGDPVEHTVSPAMHNAAFAYLNLDYVYVPFRVKQADLAESVKGIKALGIRGLSVTIPHKVAIRAYLDEIDSPAESIGAINTLVNENGWLKGYNTDAPGFLRALLAGGVDPEGKNIVILGAGGAARAIAFILGDKGAKLSILNRHPEAAREVVEHIYLARGKKVVALALNEENLKRALEDADILINATSVGMYPDNASTPVPPRLLKEHLVVCEVIYNPFKTRLLLEAENRGCSIIGGMEMLVQQGAEAFKLWTGVEAPVDIMRQAALKALKDHEK